MCGFLWKGLLKVGCWRGCFKPHHLKNKTPQGFALCGVLFCHPSTEVRGEDAGCLRCHAFSSFNILFDLIEVQVLVDGCAVAVDHAHCSVVLGYGWELAHL